jgi:hypothetical protein
VVGVPVRLHLHAGQVVQVKVWRIQAFALSVKVKGKGFAHLAVVDIRNKGLALP